MSLLFGVGASTLLTLVVIPVLYVSLMKRSRPHGPTEGDSEKQTVLEATGEPLGVN